MSSSVLEEKKRWRQRLREAVQALTPARREEESRQLRECLRQLPVWEAARTVLFYHPKPDEPDLWPLAAEAARRGREVGLLRFEPDGQGYVPCRVRPGQSEDLVTGPFAVTEPSRGCPRLDANRLDLILVPGLGFSFDGVRLGRGKGFYDRVLSGVAGFKLGVAFECQWIATLPAEPHDVVLNGILTPGGWHLVPRQARS